MATNGTEIMVSNPFQLMDRFDDDAILARLEGRVSKAWMYAIKDSDGRVQEGLSADGIEEAARALATSHNEVIREIDCRIESETDTEARFIARAGRFRIHVSEQTGEIHEVQLDSAIRGKMQPKMFRRRDGRMSPDPFWYEKGVTKACRNAKQALLPEAMIALMIEKAKGSGAERVKEGKTVPETQAQPAADRVSSNTRNDAVSAIFKAQESLEAIVGADGRKEVWRRVCAEAGVVKGVRLYTTKAKPLADGERLASGPELTALLAGLSHAINQQQPPADAAPVKADDAEMAEGFGSVGPHQDSDMFPYGPNDDVS